MLCASTLKSSTIWWYRSDATLTKQFFLHFSMLNQDRDTRRLQCDVWPVDSQLLGYLCIFIPNQEQPPTKRERFKCRLFADLFCSTNLHQHFVLLCLLLWRVKPDRTNNEVTKNYFQCNLYFLFYLSFSVWMHFILICIPLFIYFHIYVHMNIFISVIPSVWRHWADICCWMIASPPD